MLFAQMIWSNERLTDDMKNLLNFVFIQIIAQTGMKWFKSNWTTTSPPNKWIKQSNKKGYIFFDQPEKNNVCLGRKRVCVDLSNHSDVNRMILYAEHLIVEIHWKEVLTVQFADSSEPDMIYRPNCGLQNMTSGSYVAPGMHTHDRQADLIH